MSVNPDGSGGVDYSDFEYQQIYHVHNHNSLSGDGAVSKIQTQTSPLRGIGGLDNNEVAELVYMEVQTFIEHAQGDNDQDVGSETQFSGVVGANLPPQASILPNSGTSLDGTVIQSNNVTPTIEGSENSEDRVFQPFQMGKSPAFDDQTNGPGGAGSMNTLSLERPWRSLTGRGPVLDSSDDMTIVTNLRQEDEVIEARGNVQVHCVWDIAETSDAGRAFSVPMD